MLARIRKAMDEREEGFTLIELLVVMIIIGILAAIAIPVFLSQRSKARDTSTKADVSTLGKELATYYVDGAGPAIVTLTAAAGTTPASATVTDAGGYTSGTVKLSNGTTQPAANATKSLGSSTAWCVSLTNPDGKQKDYKYSADSGLQSGTCT